VEPADANAMALSLHHGQRIMLDKVGGFADGVAVKVVGEEIFRLRRELIDGVVLVSRDAICASIKVILLSMVTCLCILLFCFFCCMSSCAAISSAVIAVWFQFFLSSSSCWIMQKLIALPLFP